MEEDSRGQSEKHSPVVKGSAAGRTVLDGGVRCDGGCPHASAFPCDHLMPSGLTPRHSSSLQLTSSQIAFSSNSVPYEDSE